MAWLLFQYFYFMLHVSCSVDQNHARGGLALYLAVWQCQLLLKKRKDPPAGPVCAYLSVNRTGRTP